MVASNFSVNGYAPTPVLEFGVARDKFLYNRDSANTVYLGTDRGVTSSSGFPMGPQSTRRWVAGDPLFAICESGKTAVLNISDNAGEYNDPAANAAQILQQGLASQIASAINLVGVPSIDRPTQLYSDSRVVAAASFANYLPALDVSKYASVYVSFKETPTAAYTGTAYRAWTLSWTDSTGTIPIGSETIILPASDGAVYGRIPSKGALLGIIGSASGVESTVDVNVYGTFRSGEERLYFSNNNVTPAKALTLGLATGFDVVSYRGTTTTSGTYQAYPLYSPGNYSVYVSTNGSNTSLIIRDMATGKELSKVSPTGGTPAYAPVPIPLLRTQAQLDFNTTSATVTYNIALLRL